MAQRPNRTGFAGVTKTRHGRFAASIHTAALRHYVGCFATAVEAAAARDHAIVELGLDLPLAFPDGPPELPPAPPPERGKRRGRRRGSRDKAPRDGIDLGLDEARRRRSAARADKLHGAAIKAEVERIAAERHRDEVRQIAVRVVTAAARKVEVEIVAPACSEILRGTAEINATLAAENRRLDAAISAEALRQRGDEPLN